MQFLRPILLFSLLCSFASAKAEEWHLKKEEDGIKVYTGTSPKPNIKAVKVECEINTSLSALAALLFDAKAHEQWIYNTSISYEVERLNKQEQIYYSELEMPWPLSNRDIVIHLKVEQDAATHVMTVTATATKGYVKEIKDKVRVVSSQAIWKVTPLAADKVKIDYVGWANPGGIVPGWAVNLVATKGPFETFKRLRTLVTKPVYQAANVSFIKDFKQPG